MNKKCAECGVTIENQQDVFEQGGKTYCSCECAIWHTQRDNMNRTKLYGDKIPQRRFAHV